jgi:hypothetical protein
MDFIASIGFSPWEWAGITLVALLVGFAKAGFSATVMLAVPLLASIVEGKGSTGMMVTMFIVGDVFAVLFYKQHADWKIVRKLSLWVVVGVVAGMLVGKYVNNDVFTYLISGSVLFCLVLLVYLEVKKDKVKVPEAHWFYSVTGIVCGFTSMVGNMAGPIFNVYLLARRMDKKKFMGTISVFFFMMNLIKLPLQIFFWHNIGVETVTFDALMIPAIVVGAAIGIMVAGKIPEKAYRVFVMVMTGVAAVMLFVF